MKVGYHFIETGNRFRMSDNRYKFSSDLYREMPLFSYNGISKQSFTSVAVVEMIQ